MSRRPLSTTDNLIGRVHVFSILASVLMVFSLWYTSRSMAETRKKLQEKD